MLKGSENMLGYATKSLAFLFRSLVTSMEVKSLWSALRTLLGSTMSTGLPATGVVSGTRSLSRQPCPRTAKVLRLKAVLPKALLFSDCAGL